MYRMDRRQVLRVTGSFFAATTAGCVTGGRQASTHSQGDETQTESSSMFSSRWPRPGFDNQNTLSNTAVSGVRDDASRLWHQDVRVASPVIGDGTIYHGELRGESGDATHNVSGNLSSGDTADANSDKPSRWFVTARDLTTGRELWSTKIFGGGFAGVTLGEDTVFVTAGGRLRALSRSTGEERWSYHIGAVGSTAPLLRDETIVVANGQFHDSPGRVSAVSASGGQERWRTTFDSAGFFSGLAACGKLLYYVSSSNEWEGTELRALDTATGSERWSVSPETAFVNWPVIGERLYIAEKGGSIRGVNPETGTSELTFDLAGAADITAPPGESIGMTAPALARETLFAGVENGVYAIDTNDEEMVWHAPTEKSPTNPIVSQDTVYVGGGLTLRAIDRASGDVLWSSGTSRKQWGDVISGYVTPAAVLEDFVLARAADGLHAFMTNSL